MLIVALGIAVGIVMTGAVRGLAETIDQVDAMIDRVLERGGATPAMTRAGAATSADAGVTTGAATIRLADVAAANQNSITMISMTKYRFRIRYRNEIG